MQRPGRLNFSPGKGKKEIEAKEEALLEKEKGASFLGRRREMDIEHQRGEKNRAEGVSFYDLSGTH